MPPSDSCQINYRRGGGGEARGRQGEKGMWRWETMKDIKKRTRWKQRGLGYHCLRCRGVVEWMEGKKPCTLINNALYNSKGRKGLSLPKRGKENVYLCRNILNWTAHTRHSQKKHWLILFLLKSFQVVHLYTKGSFKDASVCVCRDKQREKRRGRKSQIVWDRYVDQSFKPSTNRRAKSSKRSQQLHHVKKVKTLLNILPKN